jgi:Ser/Thr protein kinase RdoA (MazF antagonist)
VYRVDRQGGGSWVARVFPVDRGVEQARGDAEVLRFLESKGFPAERCARPEPVSAPGGRVVLVTEFIEGTVPERSESVLRSLGELLGRLNNLPSGSGRVEREAGALHVYTAREGSLRNEFDAAASWLDEVESKVPAPNRTVLQSLREQLVRADDCHGLPKALIHPDPVLKNIIATKTGAPVLIDWTGAGLGPRLAPLAVLIWSSALGSQGWSLERVDPVVNGYRSHVQLKETELARLAGAMRARPLVFACWRYRHSVLSGKTPNGKEWWMPSDELVEAITGRARSVFETPPES